MDYTLANGYATHAGTGNRLAQDDQPVPTMDTAQDFNAMNWSLMEIVKAAGLTPAQFNKDTPASYQVLLAAVKVLARHDGRHTELIQAASGVLQAPSYSKVIAPSGAWTSLVKISKRGAGLGRSTWFWLDLFSSENGCCQPFTLSGYFVDRSNTSAFADLIASAASTPIASIHPVSAQTQFRVTDLGVANGPVYIQASNASATQVSVAVVTVRTNSFDALEWQP